MSGFLLEVGLGFVVGGLLNRWRNASLSDSSLNSWNLRMNRFFVGAGALFLVLSGVAFVIERL